MTTRDGQRVDIAVVPMDTDLGRALVAIWHTFVQRPFIDDVATFPAAKGRADRGWTWTSTSVALSAGIYLRGYEPFSFVLVTYDESGKPVPVGLAIGINPYDCVRSVGKPPIARAFAWYLTGIPPWGCEHMGIPALSPTTMIVEICRLFSAQYGGKGRIVLHASHEGRERLLRFYQEKCKLRVIPRTRKIRSILPLFRRLNDGRYLYSDAYTPSSDDDL